jgi:hypothetical protein
MKPETQREASKLKARILERIAQQKQRLAELGKDIELAEELMEEVKAYFSEEMHQEKLEKMKALSEQRA